MTHLHQNFSSSSTIGKRLREPASICVHGLLSVSATRFVGFTLLTDNTREEDVEAMRKGDTWGFCCTDSFGMVSSIAISNSLQTHQDSGHGPARYRYCHPDSNGRRHVICVLSGSGLVERLVELAEKPRLFSSLKKRILMKNEP